LPLEVRKFFGHALDFAQRGDKHDTASSVLIIGHFRKIGVLNFEGS
jgi:hypothetical protein